MKKAVVIGSGAGGATAARELQGRFDVTVIEAGGEFRPFRYNLSLLEKMRKTGLFFDEREIQLLFPAMKIRKTAEKMALVNGLGTGGTTTLATGNALRMDQDLREIGIDLNAEFDSLAREVPISTAHQKGWRPATKRLFEICVEMGLAPEATPKMGDMQRCSHCGHCVLGCPKAVKWDSRQFLNEARSRGARVMTHCRALQIQMESGRAKGVVVHKKIGKAFVPADLVVVAAGGLGTPVILQNSGITCEPRLFVDPVLCVAAEWPDAMQDREISMPFVVQQDHFILSPYLDYLSFFFNAKWRLPPGDVLSLMIKLADDSQGSLTARQIQKTLTDTDRAHLARGVEICTEILFRMGVRRESLFLGTLNAGHPGGMLPLTKQDADTLHPAVLPENVYVADATLLPKSLGNPPILTIMALAKRVCKQIPKELS